MNYVSINGIQSPLYRRTPRVQNIAETAVPSVGTAENCSTYLLPTLASKASSTPNLTLLDVGAGSGTITASLAKYMPAGHITAIDISPEILLSAASHASSVGVANITFQTESVYSLPFPDSTFDIVHAHQILCHLDSPVEALTELLRVTKPDGGVVAVRETDMLL